MLEILKPEEKLICSLVSKYPFSEVRDVIDETCEHQLDADKKWLFEPCTEHLDENFDYDITIHTKIAGYHNHRFSCPTCLKELEEVWRR